MNRTRWHNAALGGLALVLCACASTGSAAVTPSAVATQVALVATVTDVPVTATPAATVTAAPTNTARATSSATASASATATATNSATPQPSSTPTRTPSPRPTRPPATWTFTPTATDSLPAAPLYPKSPIIGWSRDAFLKSIVDSRANTHDYYDFHGRLPGGHINNCANFWADYGNWEKQPGFTDVPAAWYPLYYQLRVILQNIQVVIQPVVKLCLAYGGTIYQSDTVRILTVLSASLSQLDQLNTTAQATAP